MSNTILLTGGSGVVGQALLAQLGTERVICLTRQRPVSQANVTTVAGDIRQPRLGLDEESYRALAQQVDWVIHAAAITDFAQPWETLYACNVAGTRNVLDFAAAAAVPMLYVSTAFVHPRPGYTFNRYERSKQMAEALVLANNVPVTIVRPSIIIGDSQTGEMCKQQGIHRVIRLLLKGVLPAVPGTADSVLDVVPQDRVAEAIWRLVRQGVVGGEYWLTAGDQALPLVDGLTLVIEQAARRLGKTITMPQLLSLEAFTALMHEQFLPTLPAGEQERFAGAMSLFPFMHVAERFPSSYPTLGATVGLAPLPDPQESFRRNLAYVIGYNERRNA